VAAGALCTAGESALPVQSFVGGAERAAEMAALERSLSDALEARNHIARVYQESEDALVAHAKGITSQGRTLMRERNIMHERILVRPQCSCKAAKRSGSEWHSSSLLSPS
jgi:hypothetical protein